MTSLGEIVKILKGSKAPEVMTKPQTGAYQYIQIEDLRPDAKPRFAIDKDGTIAQKTDVLIAWDGANVGTVSFELEGLVGSTIAILRPLKDDIHTPFLGYFLRSKFDEIQSNTTGATIPHVNRNHLENLCILFPPLPEQQRIAAILQKADRLRRLRRLRRYARRLSTCSNRCCSGHSRDSCRPAGWATIPPNQPPPPNQIIIAAAIVTAAVVRAKQWESYES